MPPNEESIDLFLSVTDGTVDRARAIRYLDNNAGNIEHAVAQYFDEPNKFNDTYDGWDESQFHTERDGSNTHLHAGSSFTIDAGTDHGGGGGTSGAPTRPPSRRSNYSNKSGGGQQESGTINSLGQDTTGRQYFGPMTRDASSYVENQWAMVPISTSTARIYENADITERVRNRIEGQPVCFKPLRERDPLPSLITILGQIPKTRRELTYERRPLGHYGSNPRWWDGEDAHAGEPTIVQERDSELDVVAETVRLMAFSRESNRSYGSVEQLEGLQGLSSDAMDSLFDNGSTNDFSADVRFLVGWAHAAKTCGSHESETLFKGVGVSRQVIDGVATDMTDISHRLDLETFVSEPKSTIYELLDRMIWVNDRNGDSEDEYFLAQIPSVFVMRIKNRHTTSDAKGLGLQVPSSFYVDRYLQANVAATKQMRRERMQFQEELAVIDERKNGLNQVPHPKQAGKMLDREDLFKQTIKNFRARDEAAKDAAKKFKAKLKSKAEDDNDEEMKDATPPTKWANLAEKLEMCHAGIQEKLKDLDEQRQKIQQQITSLSAIFTENSASSNQSIQPPAPQAHYTLRGIGIGPAYETTFVYVDPQPPSSDPDAMSANGEGQWWRFEYPNGGWEKPSKVRVTEEAVLKEASDDSQEALLVYADRAACDLSIPDPPLNGGLRRFIENDSAGLAAELAEHSAAIPSIENGWPETATATSYIDDISTSTEQRPALPPRSGAPPPPAYDADTQLHEHIPGLKVEAPDGQEEWVPDLGPSVVSDAEYAANLSYEDELGAAAASGRGVSTMSMQGGRGGGVDAYGRKNGNYNHW